MMFLTCRKNCVVVLAKNGYTLPHHRPVHTSSLQPCNGPSYHSKLYSQLTRYNFAKVYCHYVHPTLNSDYMSEKMYPHQKAGIKYKETCGRNV